MIKHLFNAGCGKKGGREIERKRKERVERAGFQEQKRPNLAISSFEKVQVLKKGQRPNFLQK